MPTVDTQLQVKELTSSVAEKHCKRNTQTKQGATLWLICHSVLNWPEIYCQWDSISLCLLIWLKGWFIKAQHHAERCPLVRRVMSCRHISFSFPAWLCHGRARWAFAGFGVARGRFCWAGGCSCWLRGEPTPCPSEQERTYPVYQGVSGSCMETKREHPWERGVEWEMAVGKTMKMARK